MINDGMESRTGEAREGDSRRGAAHSPAEPAGRPHWQEFAGRFADERECLASFLALEAAETIEGRKPATLLSLADRSRPCGRNLYRLWKRHRASVLGASGISFREMADRGDSVLLLIYREEALAALLSRSNVAAFLGKAGYPLPGDLQGALTELQLRLAGAQFPHEIGVFLGYPLKDVAGFLGWGRLTFSCQGPWKIYGDPAPSMGLAEAFRQCRCRMARRLAVCATPFDCLRTEAISPTEPAGVPEVPCAWQ